MNDGAMETVQYMWINIWYILDWINGVCHTTADIQFLGTSWSTSECTRLDAVVTGGDEVSENSKPLKELTFEGPTWRNEDLCTQSRAENGS